MNDPIYREYTREELTQKLQEWMLEKFGNPMELAPRARDKWYRDNGMIHQFIRDHFPQ